MMKRAHRVVVAEPLDPAWSAWLHNFTIIRNDDGSITLVGIIDDGEALSSLLTKLAELGATLTAVEPVCAANEQASVAQSIGKERYE